MKSYRIVNLEAGMPTAADAMVLLGREIRLAKRHGLAAVKLIHGFGSTGKGGKYASRPAASWKRCKSAAMSSA